MACAAGHAGSRRAFRPPASSRYPGCGRELADGYDAVMVYLARLDGEAREIIGGLSDADLERKCQTPAGWKCQRRRSTA